MYLRLAEGEDDLLASERSLARRLLVLAIAAMLLATSFLAALGLMGGSDEGPWSLDKAIAASGSGKDGDGDASGSGDGDDDDDSDDTVVRDTRGTDDTPGTTDGRDATAGTDETATQNTRGTDDTRGTTDGVDQTAGTDASNVTRGSEESNSDDTTDGNSDSSRGQSVSQLSQATHGPVDTRG